MFNYTSLGARLISLGILGAFLFLIGPAEAVSQQAADTGALTGYIYGSDFRTPVQNAVVKLRKVSTGQEFSSRPTDASGLYKVVGVPEGRYVLGVGEAAGDFNFEYQVFIKAKEMGKLSLALVLRTPNMAAGLAPVYAAPEGTAVAPKKKPGGGFFTSPVGIAMIVVIAGAGAAVIYVAARGAGEVSPSKR